MTFPHLATRLFNVPVAILPAKAEVIIAVLAERLGIATLNGLPVRPHAFDTDADHEWGGSRQAKIFDLVEGIAVIPVQGTLVQRSSWMNAMSGMCGYDQIRAQFAAALADDEANAILLDIDSPGGEVAGCFDLADAIYAARGQKPVWAALDEMACSAAYALAAACDRVTIPRTGMAGSIGVVCMHVDWSRALAEAGLAVTFIQYGARKTDGAQEKPLSKSAFSDLQAKIDAVGNLFVGSVARWRAHDARAVQDQEAAVYQGAEAVRAGLADAVMPIDAAFAELAASLKAPRQRNATPRVQEALARWSRSHAL